MCEVDEVTLKFCFTRLQAYDDKMATTTKSHLHTHIWFFSCDENESERTEELLIFPF